MSVRMVLGRAGTGKTRWCFDQIVAALRQQPLGPPIYWLLPRQATFQAQRLLACESGMGGYFRAQVVAFEDLGQIILAECGGSAVPEVTSLGRKMILGHLLRKLGGELRFFQSVAHQPGMAAELDVTFDELERCGHDVQALDQQVQTAPDALADKLHDLRLIYGEYTKFLGQDRLDPNRRLAEALKSIRNCKSLRQSTVYVDGFYDFTLFERKVLAALGNVCKSVAITLTVDPKSAVIANPKGLPDEMSRFHRTEDAYRRLILTFGEDAVAMESPILCTTAHRFANDELAQLQASESSPIKSAGAIEMMETSDRRAEVDAAARWIKRLTAGGFRYRDIAVLMRSEDDYRDLIATSFAEHGIPFFADRRRTAAHHPLLRLIRGVLAAARNNWSHESMMAVIKTSLVGLKSEEADALENYVLAHGIRHDAWVMKESWTAGRRREDDDETSPAAVNAKAMDDLRRRVVNRLLPFVESIPKDAQIPVRSIARAMYELLEALGARQQIVQWMQAAEIAGRLEERGEHERVWEELAKLFDELVELFGDEPIKLADFSAIIDVALDGFELAITPPTVDQVLVGPVDRTRTGNVKACAVLGLSEGQFPRTGSEGTVFTDADRRTLAKNKIDLDPDSQRQLLDESFLEYIAFTRASEKLLLTRSTVDGGGRTIGPSAFWISVAARGVVPQTIAPAADLTQATPRQLMVTLMQWVRRGESNESLAAIYQWLATHSPRPEAIESIQRLAWPALSYRNIAHLEPAQASAIFPSPLQTTIRELESFRRCPYQHFASFGLGLRDRQQRRVSGQELSTVYHHVLDRLVQDLIRAKMPWDKLADEQARKRISELTQELGKSLRSELMLSTARNRYLLNHVQRTLGTVLAAQKAAAARGEFLPGLVNVRFGGEESDLPALQINTPAGNTVTISGKIDRVDVLPDGSASVVDYHMNVAKLGATDAFHGLALQLLTHLLVLESAGKYAPAAAFSVQLLRWIRKESPDEALSPDDPKFHLMVKPRGVFDARFLKKLDKDFAGGRSDVVQAMVKQDGELGNVEHNDACAQNEFSALLRHIQRRVAELADRIIAGDIGIRPFRIGNATPCASCDFRAICRFEPAPGGYDDLLHMSRADLLARVVEENS